MAFTYSYNVNYIKGTTDPKTIDDKMQVLLNAIQERHDVDHYWLMGVETVNEDDTGEHRKITLRTLTADEVTALSATKAFFYRKEADGDLYFQDANGNEVQITQYLEDIATTTFLLLDDSILSNDTYLKAVDAAGTGTVDLIKAGRNEADDADVAVLPAGTRLASNETLTEDTQIATKKDVDAVVAFSVPTDTPTISKTAGGVNTWENADISSVVGANAAMVMLKIKASANCYFCVKSGTDSDIALLVSDSHEGFDMSYISTNDSRQFMIITNSSGVFQWKCSTTTPTISITVLGYVK